MFLSFPLLFCREMFFSSFFALLTFVLLKMMGVWGHWVVENDEEGAWCFEVFDGKS